MLLITHSWEVVEVGILNNKDICKMPNAEASERIKRTMNYTMSER